VSTPAMQRIANAGDPAADPNTWYEVTNAASITAALSTIITRTASCTVSLAATGRGTRDPGVLTVDLVTAGGRSAIAAGAANGYSIAGDLITLNGSACSQFRSAVSTDSTARIEVREGCACVSSGSEICDDNRDNDCDGLIDEGCIPTNVCGQNAPAADCTPINNPPEVCDGKDNDGDGQIDEGCPSCSAPTLEYCDGTDNDCDGETDEDCPPSCVPSAEVCDGKDNDCDGQVDEGCPTEPTLG